MFLNLFKNTNHTPALRQLQLWPWGYARARVYPLPPSQLWQKCYMTQQNKRCAVIKILNAEWEVAAGWESTRGPCY